MAKVRDTHLGTVQGKVGPTVFKVKNGKTFIGAAPKKRKKSKTEPEKAGMSSMGLVSRFASAICKINKLKSAWNLYYDVHDNEKGKYDNEPFQRIVNANYHKTYGTFFDEDIRLSPGKFVNIKIINLKYSSSEINSEFKYKNLKDPLFLLYCDFYLMIHLSHPVFKKSEKIKDKHKFIVLKKSEKAYKVGINGNSCTFAVSSDVNSLMEEYCKAMVYFAYVAYEDDVPIICENAKGFLLKGMELHEADVKEHERIKSIKTQKQIKEEKAKENPDFQTVIV